MSISAAWIVQILLSSVLLLIATAAVSLLVRYCKQRSTPYLLAGLLFCLQASGIVVILLTALLSGNVIKPFDAMMKPFSVTTGILPLLMLLFYMGEIKSSGFTNLKNILTYLFPVFILSMVLLTFKESITEVRTFYDISCNSNKPDIWIRMVLVVLFPIYTISVVFHKYDWRKCLVPRKLMKLFSVIVCVCVPSFVIGMIFNFFPAIVVSFFLIICIDVLICQIEFKIRIPAGELVNETDAGIDRDSPFDDPQVWMNPDMTLNELARLMGTNRTYLLEKIKANGYAGYSDMINRKRIGYILEHLDADHKGNIIQLMFDAGFRSRSTASSEFKRIVGCSPMDYIKNKSNRN